jgi:ribonuclease HI
MVDEARDALPVVELFTDGACRGNPGPGGYGAVVKFGRHREEFSGGFRETTNNRMELMAAIVGLRALNRRCHVKLTTDSQYLAEGLSKGWARRWRDNGWWHSANQRAANHDLWAVLLDLVARHEVTLLWTRGHAGNPDNDDCDRLARQAIDAPDAEDDEGYEQSKGAGPASIPEGHPCFKCRTPVVKRTPNRQKAERIYCYDWYLHCPACGSMYMVDAGKWLTSDAKAASLFEAPESDAEPGGCG